MKNILFSIFLLGSFFASSQSLLNDYKYIIVPKKFEDFKEENQYNTSTLVKYLFIKKGFLAVYDDELPDDLNSNRCLGLKAVLNNGSSLFTTKTSLQLQDCNSKEIYRTKEGKSKIKEYKEAYEEALREAFNSFNNMDYAYSNKAENDAPITVSFKNDIKKLDVKKEKEEKREKEPKNEKNVAVVKMEATTDKQTYKNLEPRDSDIKKAVPQAGKSSSTLSGSSGEEVLYAQALSSGYQLVDSTPKIQMKILKTSVPDFYIAEKGNIQGVLFKQGGNWVFEYYDREELSSKVLNIKF